MTQDVTAKLFVNAPHRDLFFSSEAYITSTTQVWLDSEFGSLLLSGKYRYEVGNATSLGKHRSGFLGNSVLATLDTVLHSQRAKQSIEQCGASFPKKIEPSPFFRVLTIFNPYSSFIRLGCIPPSRC